LLHLRKCPFTHGCAPKHQVHFSAKSFSFEYLVLLTNLQKLSAVSNTVIIVHFYQKMFCLAGMSN